MFFFKLFYVYKYLFAPTTPGHVRQHWRLIGRSYAELGPWLVGRVAALGVIVMS